MLGDLICDVDDENRGHKRRSLVLSTDSAAFREMMKAYSSLPGSEYYREAMAKECRRQLEGIISPKLAVPYVAALGKRKLLWELLPDMVALWVVRKRR